jgi:hypothetical protein
MVGEGLLLMAVTALELQLFPSVTVTEYVPDPNPDTVKPVAPELQE